MKNIFLHIVFCFASFQSLAQRPLVLLEIDPKEAGIGEALTITVKSNVEGEIQIDLPSGFVHGYNVMNGMEQEIDYNTGKVISYYYLSQTGAMPKAGTFKFGPAYVKKGNKVYRSNTVMVTIRKDNTPSFSGEELTAKQLRQPAFGVIEKAKSEIYEGEPIVLSARIYSRFEASHLENYMPYELDGVLDKHEIGNSSRILLEEKRIKNVRLFTFEYDKKVVFPTGTGKMTIDPFKLILRRGFESFPLTSSSTTIEVKPLPANAPKDFIGAVGQYSVSRKIQEGSFKQGDVFTLTVEVSGHGNLQNIEEPKLELPKGFIVYGDPVVKEDFVFGGRGAEGKITFEFNIQVTKSGSLTLPETTFSYFDPVKEKYVQVKTGSDVLEFKKDPKFNPVDDTKTIAQAEKTDELGSLRMDEGNVDPSKTIYGTPVFWTLVSFPVILALLLGVWWKKKEDMAIVGAQQQVRKKATSEVQNLFTEAENALRSGDFTNYYGFIEKGMLRSLALFLVNDDSVVLSKSEIFSSLEARNISTEKTEALKKIFSDCEQARYGFGLAPEERDDLVLRAKQLIQTITTA